MGKDYVQLIPRQVREANWPRARFLSDEEQGKYEEVVKSRFNSEKARQSLDISQNGSNLWKVLLLNQEGIRTATIPELYNVWGTNPDFLSGHYEDVTKVVLRSAGDTHTPNDLLAKSLAKNIKKRNFKHAYVLSGLEVKEDESSDSEYGLVLVPGKDFSYFEAPELDNINNQRRFSKVNEKRMPIFEDNGSRRLYTRQDGLSRLCVSRGSSFISSLRDLSNSNSNGGVVVVDAEGVAPNLEEYV